MSHSPSTSLRLTIGAAGCTLFLASFAAGINAHEYKAPPEPKINHQPTDTGAVPVSATGESVFPAGEIARRLHAQHHAHAPIEIRRIPGPFVKPEMKAVRDFALLKGDLDVINPGPGEWVHVMEGQRHGYQNLTIGITYTSPGGAPPMHTHMGEESHVLLEGQILYALGDSIFAIQAPYIVNIPPMVPHCFMNLGDEVAELVVIFPRNVWEYDVLNYFPFQGIDLEKAKKGIIVK